METFISGHSLFLNGGSHGWKYSINKVIFLPWQKLLIVYSISTHGLYIYLKWLVLIQCYSLCYRPEMHSEFYWTSELKSSSILYWLKGYIHLYKHVLYSLKEWKIKQLCNKPYSRCSCRFVSAAPVQTVRLHGNRQQTNSVVWCGSHFPFCLSFTPG